MGEIEVCLPVSFPDALWAAPGELSERGEQVLQALGAALDSYLRRSNSRAGAILRDAGCEYRADSWATRWPGPEGEPVLAREQDDDEDE